MQVVTTEYFDGLVAAAANNHTAAGNFDGPLYGSKMGLFTNVPALSKVSVLADLTVATYAGYALASLVWTAPSRRPDGSIGIETGLITFQPSDGVTPNTITGMFIQSATGSHLHMAVIFDQTVGLVDALSALGIVMQWNSSNAGPGVPQLIR